MMKLRKNGFTLAEMLIAIGIGSMALVGMFGATIAYMRIWKEVSGAEQSERFNRETITRGFLINEISSLIPELEAKANDRITFKKLNSGKAVVGSDDAYFYWQSVNKLPFLKENKGGITECWLKCSAPPTQHSLENRENKASELRLYYRSLPPGKNPDFSGSAGNATEFVVLLENCSGIYFGYGENAQGASNIKFQSDPRFSDGSNPDLPEIIQILLAD
ncbi:MAG: prepilin-type N-terminal cleavage/methylation domain-containing protein [Puniceicoccales bacterium]|jgi:prepilin-type N-terminal cleavage/methylation domain-containing protein|nr:prepilin-type N-terminal cleavage/methylation domain-containing protein [Puniceicoccales bacterium]